MYKQTLKRTEKIACIIKYARSSKKLCQLKYLTTKKNNCKNSSLTIKTNLVICLKLVGKLKISWFPVKNEKSNKQTPILYVTF